MYLAQLLLKRIILPFVTICFFLTIALQSSANEQYKKKNTPIKLKKLQQPIVRGWEPVNEFKNINNKGWQTIAKSASIQRKLEELTDQDYSAALQAVHFALSQTPDGRIYHWKRAKTKLHGRVMPTNVFRDTEGRLCRHLIYSLSLGSYVKTIEGVACRSLNGGWDLLG